MKCLAVSLLSLLLAACATVPSAPERLLSDALFRPPSERVDASDVFALSDPMKHYLEVEIQPQLRTRGARQGLIDALYAPGQLKLDYDAVKTRNAAEAFAARSGNCLSLVIMTGAFARELGLSVRFQSVVTDETLSRSDDIEFFIGHVNLTLSDNTTYVGPERRNDLMTIDFMPSQNARGLVTRVISEETVVAMYMNNRAAEAYARGQLDDAYWWVREAIRHEPTFLSSYNTLGLIYGRHGDPAEAEMALGYALEREPQNTHVMANLVRVLADMGRIDESMHLARKLEQLEPFPPFSYFNRGLTAMREGKFDDARDFFVKEVNREPYYHEFRFWLAQAYWRLGDVEQARKQLALALEYSTTRREHDLYAAKLAGITATQHQ
jgi:Tfp pilus assembly protein PilF